MKRWAVELLGTPELLLMVQPGFACGKKDIVDGVPHLRMNNVSKDGKLDMTLIRRIPIDIAANQSRFLERGDILFNNTNSTELVGKSCIFSGWDETCTFSNHLTRLRTNPKRLLPEWLHLCLRDFWLNGYFATNCTEFVGQSAFNKDTLLELEIPIPPLVEQRRIVARVETFTSRIHEIAEHTGALVDAVDRTLSAFYERIIDGAQSRPFGEVASLVRRAVKTAPSSQYGEMGIRSFGKGSFAKPVITGAQLGTKRVYRIRAGDLVFMNVFAWEGAIAVAQPDDDERVGSHRFLTHEINPDLATPEFLCFHFLTPQGLDAIGAASPGSAGRNRTLGIDKLAQIEVPVPVIEVQRRFARMSRLQHELRRLRREVESDLAAFVPALLAKAFGGKL
jgi:type I restriction enzyme, S subunit